MSKNINRYYPQGNDFVKIPMPDGKQIEGKPTNKAVECRVCSRMREDIVARIVVVVEVRDDDGNIIATKGYNDGVCCKTCAFTTRFREDVLLLLPHEDTLATLDTIAIGQVVPTNDRGWLADSTKGEQFIKDRDRYRQSVKNMIEINKRHNLIVPTFKQEMKKKIRVAKNPLNYLSASDKAKIREMIERGEIKIE